MTIDPGQVMLEHYGVKGMKWGVRRDQATLDRAAGRRPAGVSRRTNRKARKDAKEYTQAKMFYGDGAGNRRKLIKNKVESNSKKDSNYKKAFDFHVEKTDMGKRVSQATRKRKVEDVKSGTGKTFRGVVNTIKGNPRNASAVATVVATAGFAAYKAGAHEHIAKFAKDGYGKVKDFNNRRNAQKAWDDIMKNR